MWNKALSGGGGGGAKLVEGSQNLSVGDNTITINDMTEIKSFTYSANWTYPMPGWGYVDNNGTLHKLSPNSSVLDITAINGNTVTINKSAQYPLIAPLEYAVVGS